MKMGYDENDADFIRRELDAGKKVILIDRPIDTRVVDAVCKERGLGYWNGHFFEARYYWDTRGNQFHLRFW